MNIEWDARQYTKSFSFVPQYGQSLIELIDDPRGSKVLDLGCGTGDLTHSLQQAGLVVRAMDASAEQLEIAKSNYPEIDFFQGDATNFHLMTPVDVVFSNAVLHWIDSERHPEMLRMVHTALLPEGQFVFEFGGKGNNHLIHEALRKGFEKRGYPYSHAFYFPSIGEYTPRLEAAGFKVVFARLFDRFTELEGDNGLYDWIKMFIRIPFEGIPSFEGEAIIREAVSELRPELQVGGKWHADYVRLRCKAVKIP